MVDFSETLPEIYKMFEGEILIHWRVWVLLLSSSYINSSCHLMFLYKGVGVHSKLKELLQCSLLTIWEVIWPCWSILMSHSGARDQFHRSTTHPHLGNIMLNLYREIIWSSFNFHQEWNSILNTIKDYLIYEKFIYSERKFNVFTTPYIHSFIQSSNLKEVLPVHSKCTSHNSWSPARS